MPEFSFVVTATLAEPTLDAPVEERSHELLLPMELLEVNTEVPEGTIVTAISHPWMAIFEQLQSQPDLLFEFAKSPRVFEELIAASYNKAGFKVTLTSRSNDGGKDVIAEKTGFGAIRILDQCKAFRQGSKVSADDVRAMMGTMTLNRNTSKAIVSTTSVFAPGVWTEWESYMPFRLELREGKDIFEWLRSLEGPEDECS